MLKEQDLNELSIEMPVIWLEPVSVSKLKKIFPPDDNKKQLSKLIEKYTVKDFGIQILGSGIHIGGEKIKSDVDWIEIIDKYQEKKELNKELIKLKEKEESLKVDAERLQNPDYVARYAREKYLYSKDGEYILQIPEE